MRDLGSSVLDSRREGSGLVIVVMGFLMKGSLSEESGLRRGRREEVKGFEHPRQSMLISRAFEAPGEAVRLVSKSNSFVGDTLCLLSIT